jgi:hypothetical protein
MPKAQQFRLQQQQNQDAPPNKGARSASWFYFILTLCFEHEIFKLFYSDS